MKFKTTASTLLFSGALTIALSGTALACPHGAEHHPGAHQHGMMNPAAAEKPCPMDAQSGGKHPCPMDEKSAEKHPCPMDAQSAGKHPCPLDDHPAGKHPCPLDAPAEQPSAPSTPDAAQPN